MTDRSSPPKRWHLISSLALAGGGVSIVGDAFIRLLLSSSYGGNASLPWYQTLFTPGWLFLDFLSGGVVVLLFAPCFVRRIEKDPTREGWPQTGLVFGALAGLVNSIVLAFIHLSIMAGPHILSEGIASAMEMYLIYIPFSAAIFGLPAAAIGALAGSAAEFFLRKTMFRGEIA
jgi:hypothetical protein